MKNGKIMVVTACAVGLIIGGIIGLSEIFETSWQQPEQVDNSLSAEIVDSNESVFNYPFVSRQKAIDDGYSRAYEPLEVAELNGSEYKDYMVDAQQAVNTAGENIKYLTGFTARQSVPVMAQLVNGVYTDEGIYWITFYRYLSSDWTEPAGDDYVRSYDTFIDAVSGKVRALDIGYNFGEDIYPYPYSMEKTEISTEKEQQIHSYVSDVIELLDSSTGEISEFKTDAETGRNNYRRYDVEFIYNGIPVLATLVEPFDNSVLYLDGISIEYGEN